MTVSRETNDAMGDSFESLPQALRGLAKVTAMKRSSVLFRRGERANAIFCVVRGEVRLVRCTPEGFETVQHRARPGEFFAEAALMGTHYHCDAVCSASGQVAIFDAGELRNCVLRDPATAMLWIQVLSRHLRSARMRIERLGLKGARRRILHWLGTEIGDSGNMSRIILPPGSSI
jgi:CRP-like cAMP-binding protein